MSAPRYTVFGHLFPNVLASKKGCLQGRVPWKAALLHGNPWFCGNRVRSLLVPLICFILTFIGLQRYAGGVLNNTSRYARILTLAIISTYRFTDVVKTRLQVEARKGETHYKGLTDAFVKICMCPLPEYLNPCLPDYRPRRRIQSFVQGRSSAYNSKQSAVRLHFACIRVFAQGRFTPFISTHCADR